MALLLSFLKGCLTIAVTAKMAAVVLQQLIQVVVNASHLPAGSLSSVIGS